MAVNPAFWLERRVLVTGHTGFKGGWLCLWLQQMGARVTGYALEPPTRPSLFETAKVGANMDSILGDVRDYDSLWAVMSECKPEIVFHLAAQPLVVQSYQQPVVTYATNVLGTAHVLEAVRQVGGVRAVVNVTSDKCYANREWVWGYRENDPMGGDDPYSSSKGCAELVTAAYRASFFASTNYAQHGVGLASARAGNVIGGGDWAENRLVPDIIRAFQRRQPVTIRHPEAVRPWQHVLDPLSGYLLLAERLWMEGGSFAEGWNFGPSEEDAWPVRRLAERLAALWGEGAGWRQDGDPHPHEAHYLRLDCAKAHERLDWRPRWDLARALVETVAWYRAHQAGGDMRAVTLAQINSYWEVR
ncbi:MAG: CDP-glucose 4,6-dehydratase [Synechococcaceae cyanobacterium SM1_2_3]|nr:CDP-glucose 4,6-dehydratase [Synechococcaceae cyanobacterium SM1_2_3]